MVPEGWNKTCLVKLIEGDIKNGYSPNQSEQETGYWILGLGALSDDGLASREIKPVEPIEEILRNLLQSGDFLVSRSNTPDKVGRSIKFNGEIQNCSYPDLMMRFRIDKIKASPDYIEHVLKSTSVRGYFKRCAAGSSSTMVKINKSVVEKTPINLPSYREQTKIATILSTWDEAIQTIEKLIANSQQQKKALMQKLLTGKKRLKGFSGEWKEVKLGSLIKEIKKERVINPDKIELLTVKLHHKGVVASGKFPNSTEGGRPYHMRHKGELIIGRQNLHNGGIAIVDDSCDGLIASNAISSFVNTNISDIGFILGIMSTPHFMFVIDNLSGGTGQKEIGIRDLMNIKIFVPKKEEQEKIAAVIISSDEEIKTLQSQLADLQQEKKALMQVLLTGKKRVKV